MGEWLGNTFEDFTGFNTGTNSAADRSARSQREAAAAANQMQREMYENTRNDLAAYRDAGAPAVSSLARGDFMKNWQTDPGYQFRMQEGMKALQNSAAARGSFNSGATMKALSRYGQDYASQEYGNIYNREFNRLSNLANIGQNSAAMTGQAGQNYANAYGQNTVGAANAQAAANMAQAGQMRDFTSGLVKTGMAFCDERLKTNIRPVTKSELRELKAVIKPYHFEYAMEEHGSGKWAGLIAQDLEKSKLGRTAVFEDELGRKKVHLQKLLSLLLVSMADESTLEDKPQFRVVGGELK